MGAKWGGRREKCEKLGRWREKIGCRGDVGVLGSVKDGGKVCKEWGRSVANGGESVKEWGAGEMWVCSEIRRMGRGCERMGAGEKWMCLEVRRMGERCAKNGDGL